jgi:uncharacterized protein YdaU (DUF1376 family)
MLQEGSLVAGAFNTWMPLYVADYLRKTTRLTTEQHGAYCLLIMDYWVNGAPPDDDVALAQIVRLPLNQWRKHRPVILSLPGEAFSVKDGKWVHGRIEDERMKAFAITEVRRKGGQERQRLSKQTAHAEAQATAGRPAESQQAARPSHRTIHKSSTELVAARDPLPSVEAGSSRDAQAIGSFTGGTISRLLEQAAGGKKF